MPTASGSLYARYTPQGEPDAVNSTDFSSELCGKADDASTDAPRHSHAICSVSEVTTVGIRYGGKGVGRVSDWLGGLDFRHCAAGIQAYFPDFGLRRRGGRPAKPPRTERYPPAVALGRRQGRLYNTFRSGGGTAIFSTLASSVLMRRRVADRPLGERRRDCRPVVDA